MRKIISFFEYLLAFCIIMECESIIIWSVEYGKNVKIILLGLVTFSIGIIFLINIKKIRINRNNLILIIVFYIFSIIFIINNFNNFIKAVLFLLILFNFGIYQISITPSNNYSLMGKIINITVVFAIVSIVFWIFGSMLQILEPNTTIVVTRNKIAQNIHGYYNLYYESQIENTFGFKFYRNCGIFYEAPKYALLLSIALMGEVFLNKKNINFKSIILIITIISTFSLTGIILVVLVLFFNFIISKSNSKIYNNMKLILIFSLIIIIFIGVEGLLNIKSTTNSYSDRLDDYVAGYKAWKLNPIIGNGYLNMDIIRENMSYFRKKNIGFSNSIFRVLAQGGIVLISIYIIPIILWIKKSIYKWDLRKVFFGIGFIFLFITTSFSYNYLTMYILSLFIWEPRFGKSKIIK